MAPMRSTPMMFRAPAFRKILLHATPDAPTPATTIFMSSIRFLTIFREFSRAASTTTAVPCWSSWNTGMSISALRRSSISKQRGAEISSRLIPPKVGSSALTIRMISSVSFVPRQIGQASIPPNSLKSIAFPSMTGIAASGPMSPRPRTAVPSETMATAFLRIVRENDFFGSLAIAMQTRATPGVYAMERSFRVLIATLGWTSIFPPRCIRKVRSDTLTIFTPGISLTVLMIFWACSMPCARAVTSRMTVPFPWPERSIAPMSPPAVPIAVVTLPSMPTLFWISNRIVML